MGIRDVLDNIYFKISNKMKKDNTNTLESGAKMTKKINWRLSVF